MQQYLTNTAVGSEYDDVTKTTWHFLIHSYHNKHTALQQNLLGYFVA